jgi:hypothetical protein
MFPRCVITKNCRGLMSQVSKLFVTSDQYHDAGTSSDAWVQRPMLYDHTQTAARKVWNFTHNLGTQPILNVYVYDFDGKLLPLTPDQYTVVNLTDTIAIIAFDTAQTGIVQCLVRQSANKVTYATVDEKVSTAQTVRLLYNQTIVLATRLPSVDSLTLTINANPLTVVTLNSDQSTLWTTPWADVYYVTINNERYRLYGIDAEGLSAGASSVASFWFSAINNQTPIRGDTYVLLAKEPYQHKVDRLLTSVVDVSAVNTNLQSLTSLVGSTLYCDPKLVASIYPQMDPVTLIL